VTALSDPYWVGGPFPARLTASFNPARLSLPQAGECPLNAKAIDIFWPAPQSAELLPCQYSFVLIRLFLNPYQLASRITG